MATFSGWEAAVLRAIKAPVTQANVAWLDAWQRTEGGTAAYNPLNTTQGAAGASDYNSVGVKNYTSAAQGAAATAQTLLNGRYNGVVAALRSGNPSAYVAKNRSAVVSQLSVWGSSGFALDNAGHAVGGPVVVVPGAAGATAAVAGAAALGSPTLSSLTGGFFGGLEKWLTAGGKLALAYVFLVGLAAALLYSGAKGLGVKPPTLPAVIPA